MAAGILGILSMVCAWGNNRKLSALQSLLNGGVVSEVPKYSMGDSEGSLIP